MADPSDIADDILDDLAGPQKAEADGASIEQSRLDHRIEAHRYAKACGMTGSAWGAALRPARVIPPDAIGPNNREG